MTSGNTKPSKAKPIAKTLIDSQDADVTLAEAPCEDSDRDDDDAGKSRRSKPGRSRGPRRPEPAQVAPQKPVIYDVEDDTFDVENEPAEDPNVGQLHLKISRALYHKMKHQAREEGISLEEFAVELLSEGVVLRAWEIVEKKNQLRGGNSHQPSALPGRQNQHNGRPNHNNNNNNSHNNNHRKGGGGGNRSGMSQSRYQSIMDDKATFLEYVRNQERTRR